VGHAVFAGRFEVGEDGYALTDTGKVVDSQLDVGGVGHGQKVEHRIGGTAQGNDHRDGVFERLPGHDIARTDTSLEQGECGLSGTTRVFLLFRTDSELG